MIHLGKGKGDGFDGKEPRARRKTGGWSEPLESVRLSGAAVTAKGL